MWTRRPNAGLADPPPTPTGSLSSLQLARKLLAAGANPNALMKKERKLGFDDRNLFNRIDATPFLIAAQTADVEMMRLLAANRADPYSPSRSVTATAGIPSAAARRTRSSGEKAPSRSEK